MIGQNGLIGPNVKNSLDDENGQIDLGVWTYKTALSGNDRGPRLYGFRRSSGAFELAGSVR